MRMLAQCLAVGLVLFGSVSSVTNAQEARAKLASLKTVIGQKYTVSFKVVEIDVSSVITKRLALPDGFLTEEMAAKQEIDTEFFKALDRLEESGLAQTMDATAIDLKSSEVGKTHIKIASMAYKFQVRSKVKDDDSVNTNIVFNVRTPLGNAAPQSFNIQSRLGQYVMVKPNDIVRQGKTTWIIAKIDYAAQETVD